MPIKGVVEGAITICKTYVRSPFANSPPEMAPHTQLWIRWSLRPWVDE